MNTTDRDDKTNSWFELSNQYDDVILSSRVRLVRNLADYPFVFKMSDNDKKEVTDILKENFIKYNNFSFIGYDELSPTVFDLIKDKNIISDKTCSGFILNDYDDSLSCLINESDHLKIVAFASGLDCEALMEKVYKIDELLQKNINFAANSDFGYLTSKIRDCGSGLKITLRIFIPAIVISGNLGMIKDLLKKNKCCLKPLYQSKGESKFSNCIFDIYLGNSMEGTELDQMAVIYGVGMHILKTERKIRGELADNNPTVALNFFRRNYAKGMYSLLLDYEDCVSIISAAKWGLGLGLIKGIKNSELNALFYRTKLGHLKYVCNNFNFTFENDIKDSIKLMVKRLRAIVIQQAFEGIVNEQPIS